MGWTTSLGVFVASVLGFAAMASAGAGGIESKPLTFASGASSATVKGTIRGRQVVDYKLSARAGQTMRVRLESAHAGLAFNVLPPGSGDVAIEDAISRQEWAGTLPADGEYSLRTYLPRSAGRRGEKASYTLSVAIDGGATPAAAAAASAPGAGGLAGTAWQLHSIQSMDDKQGTTRIAEPQRFTMRLGADGRASLQLDCNRGTGTWEAKPGGPDSGTFAFGPIAATRALCAPPHLDERVARDLGFVRGYRLKDGNLYLSLMADGGIYEWRPWWE